jgi:hypothetical protein
LNHFPGIVVTAKRKRAESDPITFNLLEIGHAFEIRGSAMRKGDVVDQPWAIHIAYELKTAIPIKRIE